MTEPTVSPSSAAAQRAPQIRPIRRVLVANRGEIAVRVVKACHAMGIEAVVAVSEVDVDGMAALMAGNKVIVGPAPAGQSYLRADRLVAAAIDTGCDAVHPGYGFLSERASFAQACAAAGLVFIGPSSKTIASMGDKIIAARLADAAGVPRLTGTDAMAGADDAKAAAARMGYPVLVKASAGGGGRGMRMVHSPDQMAAAFASASAEALAAFGDATVYVERLIERARHVEIQILGDQHGNIVHLGERECSTQRRHQKLIEEAPSPALSDALRARMCASAVALAHSVGYYSAGTVEFVVDDQDGNFYFLEMNTRIQVEHPVTEMVTGIDLVEEQIRVATGAPLSMCQDDIRMRGHAIECRINAEDPERNFLPRTGRVTTWSIPQGIGIRCDSHCEDGYLVTPHYDSLLGKLIVHAPTRLQAIGIMRRVLSDMRVDGPATTALFHHAVLGHPDFTAGKVTTRWVEHVFLPEWQAERKAARQTQPDPTPPTLKETS